ncbi:GID complex subunit 4, VID24 [Cichlidogyrus casuarinus]|uniref:GID complex subunit 4, VID24 n=1 Tax=Cichlidogyrus casuarinus TaxID=1844966 RepID=A0ABD2QJF6_9PLAT
MLGDFDLDLSHREEYHPVITNCLHPCAIFQGFQSSSDKKHDVEVTIQSVDLSNKELYGYLMIENLTNEYPTLTTYFGGEIISEKYPFVTGKWGANIETDFCHWQKIPAINNFPNFFKNNFDYNTIDSAGYILMRWKELFVIPNTDVKEIQGASIAGFYYVSLCKASGEINGYYYHADSERFQSLTLKYRPTKAQPSYQLA